MREVIVIDIRRQRSRPMLLLLLFELLLRLLDGRDTVHDTNSHSKSQIPIQISECAENLRWNSLSAPVSWGSASLSR